MTDETISEQSTFLEARSAFYKDSGPIEMRMTPKSDGDVEFSISRENAEIVVLMPSRDAVETFLTEAMRVLDIPLPPKPKRRWVFGR